MTPFRLALLWTLGIAIAVSIPGVAIPPTEFMPLAVDKWVHAGMFFGFGALWLQAAPSRLGLVVAAGVAFAVATELWQGMALVGRSSDPLDVAADLVGLALGLAFAMLLARRPSND